MKKKTSLKIITIVVIITTILLFKGDTKVFAEGENEVLQQVTEKQLTSLKVEIDTSKALYTGSPITKSINIYDGNVKLVQDQDYVVKYSNNIKTGKATIKVTGKGIYKGDILKEFYIVPKKAYIRKVLFSSNFKKATVEWDYDKQASGYVLYMSKSKDGEYKRVKKIRDNKTTKYKVKNLNPDKMYYFKICSYKMIDGKIYYSTKTSKPKSNTGLIAKVSLNSNSSGNNRNHNLKLACKAINETILKPGQSFNWFKVVGPASGSRGYKKAMVFRGKTKRALDYGGGVCQVSSTLYQAALSTGLKILERHQHSQPVSYTKIGKDATVTYGVNNLRFKNTKKYSIKLVMYSKKGRTTCEIYRIAD